MNPTTYAHLKSQRRDALHAAFKRGFRNVFIQDIARLTESDGNLVGPGLHHAQHSGPRGSTRSAPSITPDHPQRKGVESVPPGMCWWLIHAAKRVASGGEILTTRLKGARCGGPRLRTVRCVIAAASRRSISPSIAPAAARRST